MLKNTKQINNDLIVYVDDNEEVETRTSSSSIKRYYLRLASFNLLLD